jgi:hypothetical protein
LLVMLSLGVLELCCFERGKKHAQVGHWSNPNGQVE